MSSNEHAVIPQHKEEVGSKIGMQWFLFTEFVLFGGMILVYAIYRFYHQYDFHIAAKGLNALIGSLNSIVLITSSLTIALSVVALKKGKGLLSFFLQIITLFLAIGFLANKIFEWCRNMKQGFFPGTTVMAEKSPGENLFVGFYYAVSGFHALHVVIGIIFIAVIARLTWQNKIDSSNLAKLESAGLFWNLVVIIWIFLFPLFYLIV